MPATGAAASPATLWSSVFGDALTGFASPGARRRNRKIFCVTPEGTNLSESSKSWLQKHQDKVQSRLDKKAERLRVQLLRQPKSDGVERSGAQTARPQQLVGAAAPRMPPLAERGTEPQIVLFELEVLAERYRESLWDRHETTFARPGLVDAGHRLRERFLLCAVSRSSQAEMLELLATLRERGLGFDYAFALPPTGGGGRVAAAQSAALDAESLRALRSEMGLTAASMARRVLAVVSVELDESEIDARLPQQAAASPARGSGGRPAFLARVGDGVENSWPPSRCDVGGGGGVREAPIGPSAPSSPARRKVAAGALASADSVLASCGATGRPNVRLWLPGVPTLLVPHPRLQEGASTATADLLADVILGVHRGAPRDWGAAHSSPSLATASTASAASLGGGGAAAFASTSSPAPRSGGGSARAGGGGSSPRSRPAPPRARPPGLDAWTLGGLSRVVVSAAELSRCGLLSPMSAADANCRVGPTPPYADGKAAAAVRDGDAAAPAPPSSCAALGGDGAHPDARVFVLCMHRMHRKRHQRPLSCLAPAGSVGADAADASMAMDVAPLSMAPFEVWATEERSEPPGAPTADSVPPLPPAKGKGKKKGRRGSS